MSALQIVLAAMLFNYKNGSHFHFIPAKHKKPPLSREPDALSRIYDYSCFLVSGVRCQIMSLYSRIVRSEEKMPLLATLMISLRVHAF